MPIKILSRPGHKRISPPSSLQRLLAGGTRVASGVLSAEGLWPGAAISGIGEGIAELIEGDTPSLPRMTAEAALGAVPLGKIITGGKAVRSAIKSGAFSGTGELMREQSRGEEPDPNAIAKAGLLGALTGGIFGHYLPGGKPPEVPVPKTFEVESTAVPGGRVFGPGAKTVMNVPPTRQILAPEAPTPPQNPRTAYWAKQGKNPPAAPGMRASENMQLPFEEAGATESTRIPYQESGAYPSGSAAKSAARAAKEEEKAAKIAAKEAEEEEARQAFEDAKAGLEPQPPSVSESISAKTGPGQRGRVSTRYAAPEEEGADVTVYDDLGGGSRTLSPEYVNVQMAGGKIKRVEIPPQGTPQRQIYEKWISLGRDPETATDLAIKGLGPRESAAALPAKEVVPNAPKSPLEELLTPKAGEPPAQPGSLSTAPPEPPQGLSAADKDLLRQSGFSEEAIAAMEKEAGIQPETPPEPITPGRGGIATAEPEVPRGLEPEPPTAAPPQSPLARLFKSRVDAAGENYRAIQKAIGLGEKKLTEPTGLLDARGRPITSKNIAGAGLAREGKAAGLPPGGPAAPSAPVPPVAPEPPAAPPVTPEVEPPAIDAVTQQQFDFAEETVRKLKDMGASSEDIQQSLPEILRRKFGNESGAASPEMLAKLALSGLGAGLGGVVGGAFGHPFLGMAAGAGAGFLGPDAIAMGLKQVGVNTAIAEEAAVAAQTPEGVKGVARKIFDTLPQVQRFNLLSDVWGLPANMWFGPYGSAMMAGIEAHLSGDPRGMQVIRRLSPESFIKEHMASMQEARRLIDEGELGRAETAVMGSGITQDVLRTPGVAMTAGDLAARNILERAGFSPEEARRITLTSEPELRATKKLANAAKGSTLMQLLQPFARTPANIAEQGAYRIPGLGSAVQYLGRENPDPFKVQMVQQGLGAATGGLGFLAGANLGPEQAKIARRFMTNLGGQYSLPVGMGFAAGQAYQNSEAGDQSALGGLRNLFESLPLPSTTPLTTWGKQAIGNAPPRGIVPTAALQFGEATGIIPDTTAQPKPLTRPSRFLRKRF